MIEEKQMYMFPTFVASYICACLIRTRCFQPQRYLMQKIVLNNSTQITWGVLTVELAFCFVRKHFRHKVAVDYTCIILSTIAVPERPVWSKKGTLLCNPASLVCILQTCLNHILFTALTTKFALIISKESKIRDQCSSDLRYYSYLHLGIALYCLFP